MTKNSDIFLDNNAFFLFLGFLIPALSALAVANYFWDWQLGLKSYFFVVPIAIVSLLLSERIVKSTNLTEGEQD
jgi:membrane protein implicated in regulation of membrane protease activity